MSDIDIPSGYGQATMSIQLAYRANPWTFSHGYQMDVGGATPSDNAEAIFGGWNQVGAPLQGTPMLTAATFVSVKVIENRLGVMLEGEFVGNAAGGSVAGIPPPNVSVLVQKRTGLSGRKHRGRIYFPAITFAETEVDNAGEISSGTLSDLQDAFDLTLDSLATADLPIYLLHHEVLAPDRVTSLPVQPLIATQRRRLR